MTEAALEWQASLRQERREAIKAATAFARACAKNDVAELYAAADMLNAGADDAWRLAMVKVAKLPRVGRKIQDAFLSIWIESKMLPLRVGNRRIMANALHRLLPGYGGPPLTLYRGAGFHERRRRLYGFSWTTDVDVARRFAAERAHPEQPEREIFVTVRDERGDETKKRVTIGLQAIEGVILKTRAPSKAILLIRPQEEYYDESEVVVDPFRLRKVEVFERLHAPPPEPSICDSGI